MLTKHFSSAWIFSKSKQEQASKSKQARARDGVARLDGKEMKVWCGSLCATAMAHSPTFCECKVY